MAAGAHRLLVHLVEDVVPIGNPLVRIPRQAAVGIIIVLYVFEPVPKTAGGVAAVVHPVGSVARVPKRQIVQHQRRGGCVVLRVAQHRQDVAVPVVYDAFLIVGSLFERPRLPRVEAGRVGRRIQAAQPVVGEAVAPFPFGGRLRVGTVVHHPAHG